MSDEIVNFYNSSFPGDQISSLDREEIIQGSILEDTAPRWINHFYDPINKVGWTGEGLGPLPASVVTAFSSIGLSTEDALPATEWVNDWVIQQEYSRYGGDRTWKKALEYYANGNKEGAYRTLGHILHVLEDMSVPEHTRNDSHIDGLPGYGSPYEEYAAKYDRSTIKNLHVADSLAADKIKPPVQDSIDSYLISLSKYSNKYFFSKDTINSPKYKYPKITSEDENFAYGRDESNREFPLARITEITAVTANFSRIYSILNREEFYPILDAYFSHVSRQTVIYGAGVIALFQKQAKNAVVNKEYQIYKVDTSALTIPTFSLVGEGERVWNVTQSFFAEVDDAVNTAVDATNKFLADTFGASSEQQVSQISTGNNSVNQEQSPTRQEQPANSPPKSRKSKESTSAPAPAKTIDVERLVAQSKNLAQEINQKEPEPVATTTENPIVNLQATITTIQNNSMVAENNVNNSVAASQCHFTTDKLPSRQGVIVNEIAWMGSINSASDEWIELKNISLDDTDLTGWQLLNKSEKISINFSKLKNSTVPAGGFILLKRTDDNSVPGIPADLIYTGALANSNEGLRLFDSRCSLIDEVLADPSWPAGNNSTKETMERDSNNYTWHTSALAGGTPKKENSVPNQSSGGGGGGGITPSPVPITEISPTSTPSEVAVSSVSHILISEIQAGTDKSADDEFVELWNPSAEAIDLSGWSLKKKTASGNEYNLVSPSSFTGIIKSRGFFLIAHKDYEATVPADLTYSNNSNPLSYDNNSALLYDGSGAVVDEVSWTEIPKNQSLEREAFRGSACLPATGSGEYLGNGCATGSSTDFDIRPNPNPQNTTSLPEPRSGPAVKNFNATHSSGTLELILTWEPDDSTSPSSTSSLITYELKEYGEASSTILIDTASTTFIKYIREVGRSYNFSIQAFDAEGLRSSAVSTTTEVPSILANLSFYKETPTSTDSFIEAHYNKYPFIPGFEDRRWNVVVFHLNSEPFDVGSFYESFPPYIDSINPPGAIPLKYRRCSGGYIGEGYALILPVASDACGIWGGAMNVAFAGVGANSFTIVADGDFRDADYLTASYYADLSWSMGAGYGFGLVLLDKAKYYFSDGSSTPTSTLETPNE